jgi:environmental stress-induced protein Ves
MVGVMGGMILILILNATENILICPMKFEILHSTHFLEGQWTGGTTTQLYISPPGSTYTERNFDFRISSAKVNVETSNFTSLPGIQRKLMVLEGEMTVFHKGQYQTHLRPFDQDEFPGDWETTSHGKCIDFNVMTTGNWKSELAALRLEAGENKTLSPEPWCRTFLIYVFSGSVEGHEKEEKWKVFHHQLVVADIQGTAVISIHAVEKSDLVVVQLGR